MVICKAEYFLDHIVEIVQRNVGTDADMAVTAPVGGYTDHIGEGLFRRLFAAAALPPAFAGLNFLTAVPDCNNCNN